MVPRERDTHLGAAPICLSSKNSVSWCKEHAFTLAHVGLFRLTEGSSRETRNPGQQFFKVNNPPPVQGHMRYEVWGCLLLLRVPLNRRKRAFQ